MSDRDYAEKPVGDQIRISLNSGANCSSTLFEIVTAEDLGLNSRAEWDQASEEKRLEVVVEYFNGMGYPEYGWDDSESAKDD